MLELVEKLLHLSLIPRHLLILLSIRQQKDCYALESQASSNRKAWFLPNLQHFIDSGAERTQRILLAIILDPLNEIVWMPSNQPFLALRYL
jgi:hypothetical protein